MSQNIAAEFDLLDHPVLFAAPELLSSSSGWNEHIPLAFLLVDVARPRLLVELGTHSGVSDCAFCQAVKSLGLLTRCFAVDTWQGDDQSGRYSAQVLNDLRARHDPQYAAFSTLVQSSFDQALARFEDRSIDLLHIDGLHTYEAVRHDFESWKPKLSDAAVVLFHDTAETRPGFGVHRLWAELEGQFPGFEFKHGHGLGVLGVGKNLPTAVTAFLAAARARPDAVRSLFAALGARCALSLVMWCIQQQRLLANQWKQRAGLAPRGSPPENLESALRDAPFHAAGALEEMHELIQQQLLLMQRLPQGNPGR